MVRIPIQRSHLVVNAFETELPLFTHIVGDIAETVEFRRLSLLSSSMPMTVTVSSPHYLCSILSVQRLFKVPSCPSRQVGDFEWSYHWFL